MSRARKPPKHLDGISGAELRRREERPKSRPPKDAAMEWHSPPRVYGPTRDDFEGRPEGTARCLLCGGEVIWSFEPGSNHKPKNRNGSDHHSSCDLPREIEMTTAVAVAPAAIEKKPFITVQTGPRNARTDPTTGLRFYTWAGEPPVEVPSVTTIQRMAGIPHGLHQWALGQVIKHVVGHADEIAGRLQAAVAIDAKSGPGSPLGLETVTAILGRELRAAATAERDKAAALGTAVHDAAATGRQVADVDEALRPRLRQYLHWLEVSGAEILGSEFQCWNFTEGYAGTADLLVRLRDGRNYLVDLKTGKGIYRDHVTQLMAYLQAEFVGADGIVDVPLTEALGVAAGMAVLHLSDTGWEFLAFRPEPRVWEAFRGLLRFAMFMASPGVDDLVVGRREGAAPPAEIAA